MSEGEASQRLAKQKAQGQFYRVMVNLPVIIREKELIERKHTIEVFKRKNNNNKQKQQTLGGSLLKKNKEQNQMGRIYINELWSEKFHKLVLKESKIEAVLERISKLYRRNVEDFVDDIHQASKGKQGNEDQIISKHLKNSLSMDITQQPPSPEKVISLPKLTTSPSSTAVAGAGGQHLQQSSSTQNILNQSIKSLHLGDIDSICEPSQMNSYPSPAGNKSFMSHSSLFKLHQHVLPAIQSAETDGVDGDEEKIVLPQTVEEKRRGGGAHAKGSLNSNVKRTNRLAQPKHDVFRETIKPSYFNFTQDIISKCQNLNEEWVKERPMQSSKIPFYISKDDRY